MLFIFNQVATNIWYINSWSSYQFTICTVFMVKQSYDLIIQFKSIETQISVQYDYQDDVIPGVTLCLSSSDINA